MTAEEMQYNFELKMNTVYSITKPWQSYDIDQFLNRSQDDVVEDRYSPADGDMRNYFESNEKIRTELAELIMNISITSFNSSDSARHQNGVFADVPDDYLFALQEECSVIYIDCNATAAYDYSRVKPITHDEYMMNKNNAYKSPYRELVWRMDYNSPTGDMKRHELITDGTYTISDYRLRYLRRPARINIVNGVDCELNSSLHEEIVDRAARFAASLLPQPENVEQKSET